MCGLFRVPKCDCSILQVCDAISSWLCEPLRCSLFVYMSFSKLAANNRSNRRGQRFFDQVLVASALEEEVTPDVVTPLKRHSPSVATPSPVPNLIPKATPIPKARKGKSQECTGQGIKDGSFARQETARMQAIFNKAYHSNSWSAPKLVTVATGCSGSEMPSVVLQLMSAGLDEDRSKPHSKLTGKSVHTPPGRFVKFQHIFSCEIDGEKAAWIARVHTDDTCIFKDVCHLGQQKAWCWRHGKECAVKRADWYIAGFSCKDFSSANRNRGSHGTLLNGRTSTGGSADTFWGCLSYIASAAPYIIVLENVDTLTQDSNESGDSKTEKKNKDVIMYELAEQGYEVQWVVLDSADFWLAQRRRRVYIIGIRSTATPSVWTLCIDKVGGFDALFKRLVSMIQECKIDPCTWETLLCDDDDPVCNLVFRSAFSGCAQCAKHGARPCH